MSITEQLAQFFDPAEYALETAEYEAVTTWLNAEKDQLPWEVKKGLLKLINGEQLRRMSK